MVSASGARAVARCDTLGVAPFSATPNGLFRAFLTPAHAAALKQTAAWMREAGMGCAAGRRRKSHWPLRRQSA